jgi:hypothetical protein
MILLAAVVMAVAAAVPMASVASRSTAAAIAATPVKFAVIGDFGVADANEQTVANIVSGNTAEFVVTVGDNIYSPQTTYANAVTPY